MCTIASNHIYSGAYTYSSNILYTFDGKHVYTGAYDYSSNIVCTFDGPFPKALLPVIL